MISGVEEWAACLGVVLSSWWLVLLSLLLAIACCRGDSGLDVVGLLDDASDLELNDYNQFWHLRSTLQRKQLCTWRILCFCGNCNPEAKLTKVWKMRELISLEFEHLNTEQPKYWTRKYHYNANQPFSALAAAHKYSAISLAVQINVQNQSLFRNLHAVWKWISKNCKFFASCWWKYVSCTITWMDLPYLTMPRDTEAQNILVQVEFST